MHYGQNKTGQDKRVTKTIILIRDELVADIRNNAFIQSKNVPTEIADTKTRVSDVAEMNNREKMFRSIGLAFGRIVNNLMPFSANWYLQEKSVSTDAYKEPHSYVIHLHVPVKFPEETHHYLKKLAHEFIVDYALWDFLSISYPDAAAIWKVKADDVEEQIKTIANKNYGGIIYRPLQPF